MPDRLNAATTSVMILAAGHGKRMLPLTAHTPKPLLKVGARSLIEHHLRNLAEAGFKNVVINVAYLGQMIIDQLGSGQNYGLSIRYSDESSTGALETAGGIVQALPLLESDPFLVINGDIYSDFLLTDLLQPLAQSGRLVLVPNPRHNESGDFSFNAKSQRVTRSEDHNDLTFSGIALYRKSIFSELAPGTRALAPLLFEAAAESQLEGVIHTGEWHDVGTPARLKQLDRQLSLKS